MSGTGFQVQADAIVKHAGTVEEVAAEVMQAKAASSTISMGRDAYGLLCQLIPSLLDPLQDAAIGAFQEAADSLQRSADNLRTTARDYTGSDESVAGEFGGDR